MPVPNDIQDEYKKCPFCAENIKKDAIICRFCQRTLNKTGIDQSGKQEIAIMDKKVFLDLFLDDSSNLSNMEERERHGFLTFWLVFGIVMNAIVAFVLGIVILGIKSEGSEVTNLGYISFILYFTGCICNILLLKWKISGFYIYCIVAMISCLIEPKGYIIITGIFWPLLTFTFLQLKENDTSAWTHLTSRYSNLDNIMDFNENKNIFSEYNSNSSKERAERTKFISDKLLYFIIGILGSLLCRIIIGRH